MRLSRNTSKLSKRKTMKHKTKHSGGKCDMKGLGPFGPGRLGGCTESQAKAWCHKKTAGSNMTTGECYKHIRKMAEGEHVRGGKRKNMRRQQSKRKQSKRKKQSERKQSKRKQSERKQSKRKQSRK